MRKMWLLVACLIGVNGFTLPFFQTDEGEVRITNDGTTDRRKPYRKKPIDALLEVKGGYFFFSDAEMRKVYDDGGLDVQLAFSGRVWKWFFLYTAAEYVQRTGYSVNAHQSTEIQLLPISLGLKPTFRMTDSLDYYLNIGPRYFFVWQSNKSDYVNRNIFANGLGGFVGTDFLIKLNERLILDAFGEFSFFSRNFSSFDANVYGHTVQIGGFTFGGGLGYSF